MFVIRQSLQSVFFELQMVNEADVWNLNFCLCDCFTSCKLDWDGIFKLITGIFLSMQYCLAGKWPYSERMVSTSFLVQKGYLVVQTGSSVLVVRLSSH